MHTTLYFYHNDRYRTVLLILMKQKNERTNLFIRKGEVKIVISFFLCRWITACYYFLSFKRRIITVRYTELMYCHLNLLELVEIPYVPKMLPVENETNSIFILFYFILGVLFYINMLYYSRFFRYVRTYDSYVKMYDLLSSYWFNHFEKCAKHFFILPYPIPVLDTVTF